MLARILFIAFFLGSSSLTVYAQKDLLQSGPMVGYSTMREVMLWVQTNTAAEVHISYWEKGKKGNKKATASVKTQAPDAYIAHLKADQVEPGLIYEYALFINGKEVSRPYPLEFQTQALWQYRTDPPSFKFAFGSCNFVNEEAYDRPGDGYGGDYQIFEEIAKRNPDFMLWGGDNTYLREADYDSETGILKRNTHTRSLPEVQALLGSTHNYAIWDDHDFGPNNSNRSFWNKELTTKAFKLFWANPNYGVPTGGLGTAGFFQWADADFYLMDNRSFRSPINRTTGERCILGKEQEDWLIDRLKTSYAPFKFVVIGGQFVSMVADKENHARYAEERARILRRLREEKIDGVIFLTGDRHHTVLSKLYESDYTYPLYDFTISPLTSGTHSPSENNVLMVPNTLVTERNFAEMEISGPMKERVLRVRVLNAKGKELWTYEVKDSDLKHKK